MRKYELATQASYRKDGSVPYDSQGLDSKSIGYTNAKTSQ